jgi:ankyrin repeat protein
MRKLTKRRRKLVRKCKSIKLRKPARRKRAIQRGGNRDLIWAARDCDHNKILRLLNNGADVNFQDKFGNTPLNAVASDIRFKCMKCLEVLLNNGADIDKTSDLMEEKTPLWLAATGGNEAAVELLIKRGADVNKKTERGSWTPAWIAAYKGHAKALEVLIKNRANMNITDVTGLTPLAVAEQQKNTDCINVIKSYKPTKSAAANKQALKTSRSNSSRSGSPKGKKASSRSGSPKGKKAGSRSGSPKGKKAGSRSGSPKGSPKKKTPPGAGGK